MVVPTRELLLSQLDVIAVSTRGRAKETQRTTSCRGIKVRRHLSDSIYGHLGRNGLLAAMAWQIGEGNWNRKCPFRKKLMQIGMQETLSCQIRFATMLNYES